MDFSKIVFRRKFALTHYKDLQLPLSEMSFAKDFVNDDRGDPYPVLYKSETCVEEVKNNRYAVLAGSVCRWMGAFFPYASYAVNAEPLGGQVGFRFQLPTAEADIHMDEAYLYFRCGDTTDIVPLPELEAERTMIVSCRPGAFDIYFEINGGAVFCRTFDCKAFTASDHYEAFSNGSAALSVSGKAVVSSVRAYLDCGISQADIRHIRYENGEVLLKNGKIWLTVSVRLEAGCYQGVFSHVPGTAEFELTGALFFDAGDGIWAGDVASSILFHREKRQFLLWVCSFSHGHILGHAAFSGDPRYGVNVIDISLMRKAPEDTPITAFLGFEGDEDPDFYYDRDKKKWFMAVCRLDPAISAYRYMFFEADHPFDGYRYIGQGADGAETGGSFVKIHDERYFVCGNDFNKTSDYRIYGRDGMQKLVFDYKDGGFRGWGTLIPVKFGSRTRHFLLTFDRHNGSAYNWSYGNLYCFEADI